MNAKANRNKNATATSTQKTPVEHPFFLSGCREGESDSGGISSLIVFYAQHLSAGEQARGLRLPGRCGVRSGPLPPSQSRSSSDRSPYDSFLE